MKNLRQWRNFLERQLEFIEYEKEHEDVDLTTGERAYMRTLNALGRRGEEEYELAQEYANKYNKRIGNRF